jgi:hypothetical protein
VVKRNVRKKKTKKNEPNDRSGSAAHSEPCVKLVQHKLQKLGHCGAISVRAVLSLKVISSAFDYWRNGYTAQRPYMYGIDVLLSSFRT